MYSVLRVHTLHTTDESEILQRKTQRVVHSRIMSDFLLIGERRHPCKNGRTVRCAVWVG